MENFKQCCFCLAYKLRNIFVIDNRRPDGMGSRCRQCANLCKKIWYAKTKIIKPVEEYKYMAIDPKKQYKYAIKYKFGLTMDQYIAMCDKQNGTCAICLMAPKDKLCIDHNHTTNKVRGLLRRKCNAGIGALKDDINLLTRAIEYLKLTEGT